MTWQSFFDFSTMAHRHLVFVYVGVWALQGGLPRLDRLELEQNPLPPQLASLTPSKVSLTLSEVEGEEPPRFAFAVACSPTFLQKQKNNEAAISATSLSEKECY